jgi:hypothetical protein
VSALPNLGAFDIDYDDGDTGKRLLICFARKYIVDY